MEIILPTQSDRIQFAKDEDAHTLVGLKGKYADGFMSRKEWVEVMEWTYPELGPGRMYPPDTILSIGIVVPIAGHRFEVSFHLQYENGYPRGGKVRFIETDKPETPYTTGNTRRKTHLFGQPYFLQGDRFPHVDNVCAFPLATIETNWADAGNENLFVILGPDGYPTDIYHEYSCC